MNQCELKQCNRTYPFEHKVKKNPFICKTLQEITVYLTGKLNQ